MNPFNPPPRLQEKGTNPPEFESQAEKDFFKAMVNRKVANREHLYHSELVTAFYMLLDAND